VADMLCAVISSTAYDLPAHREAAEHACLREHFFPVMMEHQAKGSADGVQLSLELVNQADVYILILGRRYGEIPQGQDKSFTHLELDRASERGIPKLVLLMADDHPLLAADVETGPGAERVRALREQVRHEQAVNFFSSPDDLRAKLIAELAEMRNRLQPRTASFHYVRRLVTPPEPYIPHPYTLLQTSEVIGRQRELNVLTDWSTGSDASLAGARILIFVAIGGIGKSAVTWKWFNEVSVHEMRPLAGRIWWSFYESDARFDNFVSRTLAYVSGRSLEQVGEIPTAERVSELLTLLDQEPYLVVLDGMERLLLAYAGADAAHLADDDLDTQTANSVAIAQGLPAHAGVSFTGQSRLRMTADPRVGDFLRRVTGIRASRVLATSRLYPTDLQTVIGEPVQGAAAYFVEGLSDDDAVTLWRAFGVTGSRRELVALFNTFGNYPLLIRALAGEVARYRLAPRDFDRWRQAHAEFNPFRLPLVQRKSHVLQYALGGLTDTENRVLHTIAAFRAPTNYDTLAALVVGHDKPCPDEPTLDVFLSDLEDRGLVGWDRRGNRYDLHPVVRGVAWAALDPESRHGIYQNLASHFEALPRMDESSVKSIDDLAVAIELYHTLVQLNRADDAFEILNSRILDVAIAQLGAFHEVIELTELFLVKPHLMELLGRAGGEGEENAAELVEMLGICYYLCGDPARALEVFDSLDEAPVKDSPADIFAFKSMIMCQKGALAAAERSAREAINLIQMESDADCVFPFMALAVVLIRCGKYEEGKAWLDDYRRQIQAPDDPDYPLYAAVLLPEYELATLRQDDHIGLQVFAQRMTEIAARSGMPLVQVQAMTFAADVARAQGEHDQAHDLLNDALVLARESRLTDNEAGLLIQLGYWNSHYGRLDAARTCADNAMQIAEHVQLRLRQVDALNLLSGIERSYGNQRVAASAAAEAYRQAWCDGPPFVYEWGIRQARENLAAVGEPEPTNLPTFSPPSKLPELTIVPTSLIDALTLQPPLSDTILRKVIHRLPRGYESIASLRELIESTSSREVRLAAIERLQELHKDSDR
jgi:tetratricopeptide (TPR) repeat protein